MKKPMIKQHITGKKGLSFAMALILTAFISAGWSACALQGYSDGKLSVVSEPGEDSSYVHYYIGGQEKQVSDMPWVDSGHTGKAISLSGNGDFLEIDYNQLQMHTMTFSGWFYWRGAAQGQDDASQYKQRLFTLSHSDDIWLSVMPHAKDDSRTDQGGNSIDGIYMGFAYNSNKLEFWNPAVPGKESYGLPQNEWHHIAVTMDGQNLKLYIDGRLWFQKLLILGVEEMRNNMLTIGSGRWGDPTLNALIDDMSVYSSALSADQISMLYAGTDPLASSASVPAVTKPSLPTAPESTQNLTGTTKTKESDSRILGLPSWTVFLIGGILVVFIGLSVLLSVYQPAEAPKSAKKSSSHSKSGRGGGKL